MKKRKHLILLALSVILWFTFYLIGIPSEYYINWDSSSKILLTLITIFEIAPVISYITLVILEGDYLKTSL